MTHEKEPPRAFISFARDDPGHIEAVRQFREVLRDNGIDARWDGEAGPQVWSNWMSEGIETGDYVLVIASAKYKLYAENKGPPGEGRGVRWEARLIADKLYNEDDQEFLEHVLPVILPGRSVDELPNWLTPQMRTHYDVSGFTLEGIEDILRHVFKRPYDPPIPVKPPPSLSTRQQDQAATTGRPGESSAPAEDIATEFARALGTFQGRRTALVEIAAWLREADDRSSRYVTSGPGSGKTALLGLVAHLAGGHEYRKDVPLPKECVPPPNSIELSLYVRNMVPSVILARIANAAGIPSAEVKNIESAQSVADSRVSVISHLQAQGRRMTVLLDALDEESMPQEGKEEPSNALEVLGRHLLRPLVADPDSPIRFLLGGRTQTLRLAGFGPTGEDPKVIDLDGAYKDTTALRERVGTVLRGLDPRHPNAADHPSPWEQAPDTVVEAALDKITEIAGLSFQLGEVIARQQARLANLPNPNSPQWIASLPRSAGPAMHAELEARLGNQVERAIGLLLPLAYGRGEGIPWTEVWLPLANALRPKDTPPYGDADLQWIRTHASSYVVDSRSSLIGRLLFRLYHQSFGDYLRDHHRYPDGYRDQASDERVIVGILLSRVPVFTDGSRDWADASPYLRNHLLEHAAAGGLRTDIDELVLDPGFLANGRDAELRAALGNLTEPQHRAVADAYSSTLAALLARYDDVAVTPPTGGRGSDDACAFLAQLSLAARCRGLDALAERIRLGNGPGQAPWQATWAAWRQQPPHVRLPGNTGRVRAIATAKDADGRVVAVTAGEDGGVRIWDVLQGILVRHIPRAHDGGAVLGLATGTLGDGRAIIVSSGDDATTRVWDLNTAEAVVNFTRHQAPVYAIVVAELRRGTTVVSGDERGTVRVWDPRTGREARPPYETPSTAVTAMALLESEGATRLMSAYNNGDIRAWDLARRTPHSSNYAWPGARPARALAVAERDGQPLMVSAGDDGAIYVWDPATNAADRDTRPEPLAIHTPGIWALAIAEVNGRSAIVSAGADHTARVWDLTDGAPIGAPFTGHTATIRALAAIEAGNRAVVISGGDDVTPMVWDLTAAGAANEPFTGHRDQIRALKWTEIDGRNRLLSGSRDATVRRWDPDSGAQMGRALEGHHQWVGALEAMDVAGQTCILSGGADTTVRIRDAASGQEVTEPLQPRAGVTALLVTSVGAVTRVVSACLDGTVQVWDPSSTGETVRYPGHKEAVRALCTIALDQSEPDPLVVSADEGGDLHVWHPASGEPLLVKRSGHPAVTALANLPSRPSWVVSGGDDGVVRLHDLVRAGDPRDWDRHPKASAVHAVVATATGDSMIIVSAHADGSLRFSAAPRQFADYPRPRRITSYRAHLGHARVLAVGTAGGRPAIFSGGDDAVIRVWDVERQAPLRTLHRGPVRSLAVAARAEGEPDAGESVVVSGSDDDTIQFRSLDWGQTRQELVVQAHHRGVRALAVPASEPSIVISGGVDHRLRVWDSSSGKLLGQLSGHGDWVRALATGMLPSVGAVAVSASGDGHVGVWDLGRVAPIGAPRHLHSGWVRAIGVAEITTGADGSRPVIVSGSADKTVMVSVLATGELVGDPFTGHQSGVRALATTSLGTTPVVISGDDDGAVLVWNLATRASLGRVPHGRGEVNAIAAQQRGYDEPGCTWVAVATVETITVSCWTAERSWEERATVRFGCEVLDVTLPQESWDDEPPGPLVVGATQGVVALRFAEPV
jgi:WD40 repeat protein